MLATPTAIMAGIGNASRRGILIKSGEALEKAARIDTIAFDKTGTIIYGKPEVVDIISLGTGYTENKVLQIAAVAEKTASFRNQDSQGTICLKSAGVPKWYANILKPSIWKMSD